MSQAVILFDGVCNLCNSSVKILLKLDRKKHFKFASLQSNFGQTLLKENNLDTVNFASFVYLENEAIYQKSTAVLRLSKHLVFPFNLAFIFLIVPKFIRDFVYGIIAKYRYTWFGKRDECLLPTPELKDRFIA